MIDTKKTQEILNDPRTGGRANLIALNLLLKGIEDIPTIFSEIDKAFSAGRHRSPNYIKAHKASTIKLINKFKLIVP